MSELQAAGRIPMRDASGARAGLTDRLAPYAGWIRWLAIALLAVALFLFMGALPVGDAIRAFEGVMLDLGPWGLIVFALAYVIAVVALVPGSALTVAAGAIFGPLWGGWGLLWATLAVALGANTGAALALLIGRYLARDRVRAWARRYPRFGAVDRAIQAGGWKIVALLRLSPAIPFNLQNYLYGLTPIGFWTCVLTSVVAMLPGTFLYVYLGYLGRVGAEAAAGTAEAASTGEWVMLGLGLVATVAVTVYITRLARRMLRHQTEIEPEQPAEQEGEPEQPSRPERAPGPVLRRALALLLIAVLAFAGACTVRLGGLLEGLFGPPAVTMTERYKEKPDGPSFDHSRFAAVLDRHVNENGGVDYEALMESPEDLLAYNASLAEAPWEAMGRDEKLALLINAYNSFTLELMIEWLPREGIEGIRDIPADRRWEDERWNIGGNVWSLDQIEHEQIRANFVEPNYHFAAVCAAVGCPPLRHEPYTGERLDEQLREQAQIVHTDGSRWFRYDREAGVVHLTPLYRWYRGDFESVEPGILEYAGRYHEPLAADLEAGRRPSVRWMEYDWSLNDQQNLP